MPALYRRNIYTLQVTFWKYQTLTHKVKDKKSHVGLDKNFVRKNIKIYGIWRCHSFSDVAMGRFMKIKFLKYSSFFYCYSLFLFLECEMKFVITFAKPGEQLFMKIFWSWFSGKDKLVKCCKVNNNAMATTVIYNLSNCSCCFNESYFIFNRILHYY